MNSSNVYYRRRRKKRRKNWRKLSESIATRRLQSHIFCGVGQKYLGWIEEYEIKEDGTEVLADFGEKRLTVNGKEIAAPDALREDTV